MKIFNLLFIFLVLFFSCASDKKKENGSNLGKSPAAVDNEVKKDEQTDRRKVNRPGGTINVYFDSFEEFLEMEDKPKSETED